MHGSTSRWESALLSVNRQLQVQDDDIHGVSMATGFRWTIDTF